MTKKICLLHCISEKPYIIWLSFMVSICKMIISSSFFFHFLKILIFGSLGGKRAKNDLKLPVSVCFAQYLRNCRSYHQYFDNGIYRCFSLYFFKKCNIVNIKIILFLLAHFNRFFDNNLFFKFINKCQKEILRCAPPFSHVCNFFFLLQHLAF